MKIEMLLPLTQQGLRFWGIEIHDDEMLFDANASSPEFWSWTWFQLRATPDTPRWFPSGKWATLQRIEELLNYEATGYVAGCKALRSNGPEEEGRRHS